MENTDTIKLPFIVRLMCVLISLYLLVYVSIIGQKILVPLFIGFLIALLLLPIARLMENKLKFPRIVSSLVSPILFVFFVIGVFYLLGTQIVHFKDDVPEFKAQMLDLFHQAQVYINDHFGVDEKQQLEYISENAESTLKKGTTFVGQFVGAFTGMLASASFVFLYIFFILLYRNHLVKFLIWCFNPKYQLKVKEAVLDIQIIMKKYLFGLMIQVVCITIMMFIAFSIIGIKYAFLFAALCGILNLIPYVGIFSATVLAAIVTLATGEPIQALWVIVSVIVVNSIDGNIITPKIIGSKVQVNSFIVLFGIIVAESLWGIAGMFLAIPLLAILKIIFDKVEGLRPYGFLLGEDGVPTPLFEKYYNKYLYRRRLENEESVDKTLKKDLNVNESEELEKKNDNLNDS